MRVTIILAATALVLATTAGLAADADLTSRKHDVRGDLGPGDVDRLAFVAPAGTRLDVRLEAEGSLALDVRVVGPLGVVDPGSRLRIEDGGEKIRLKKIHLEEAGLHRLEIRGTGAGAYEGRLKLILPGKIKQTRVVPTPGGMPEFELALPPGATWGKIRVKPRSGSPTVEEDGFFDPKDDVVGGERRPRTAGFEIRPDPVGARPGLYTLRLSHSGGAGEVRIKAKLSPSSVERTLLDLDDGTVSDPDPDEDDDATEGEVLIRLAKGVRLDDFRERHDDFDIEPVEGTDYYRVILLEDEDEDDILEDLLEDSRVLHAERNLVAEAPEGDQSSLPALDDNIDEEQFLRQPGLERIGTLLAHGTSTGAGRVVAVLDTGIDPDHPFLSGRIAPGGIDLVDGDADPREERNGADDDGDGDVDEGYGHGTFVAGLVLAVAPDARILPIRVLNSDARGEAARVAEGIIYAVESGADVINLSLGTLDETRIIRDAIQVARDRDVVIVVAAGNEADQIQFPARYGNTVAVTAVDAAGVAADFTNLGSQADLAAPGVDLIGPMPIDSGALWARWSGTSFAAPLVSGSAALVRAARPDLDGDDAADRLMDSSESLEGLNPALEGDLGEGLVRPDLAVIGE